MEIAADTWALIGTFVAAAVGIATLSSMNFKELRGDMKNMREHMHSMETALRGDIHKLDKKVDGLEIKVNNLDDKVNKLDKKVDGLEVKVNDLDKKVGGLEVKVNDLDKKFVGLDTKVTHMEGMLHSHVNGHSHPPRGGMQS